MIKKLTEQKITIAGKEYIYPDTTAIVGKFNEIIDTVNKLQSYHNHTPNLVTDDPFGPHPNIYEQSMRADKEFAEAEMVRLQKKLDRIKQQLDLAVAALKEIGATYPRITDLAMKDIANNVVKRIQTEG